MGKKCVENNYPSVPTEEEVRRFFQEAYYVDMTYDSESGDVNIQSHDKTNLIYPVQLEFDFDD